MSEIERLKTEREEARLDARRLASILKAIVRHVRYRGSLQKGCTHMDDAEEALKKHENLKTIEPS